MKSELMIAVSSPIYQSVRARFKS